MLSGHLYVAIFELQVQGRLSFLVAMPRAGMLPLEVVDMTGHFLPGLWNGAVGGMVEITPHFNPAYRLLHRDALKQLSRGHLFPYKPPGSSQHTPSALPH